MKWHEIQFSRLSLCRISLCQHPLLRTGPQSSRVLWESKSPFSLVVCVAVKVRCDGPFNDPFVRPAAPPLFEYDNKKTLTIIQIFNNSQTSVDLEKGLMRLFIENPKVRTLIQTRVYEPDHDQKLYQLETKNQTTSKLY